MRQALSPSYVGGGWREDRRRRDFSARSLPRRTLRVGSAKWEQLLISVDTFRSQSCHDSVQLIREHLLAILRKNRPSAMARLASLTLLIMLAPALPDATAQQIRFVSESIVIRVAGDSCQVEGIYVFANPAPERAVTTLLYPFAISHGLPPPVTVGVWEETTGEPLPYREASGALQFSISVASGQAKTVHVQYWQRTPEATMTYLLSTTRHWNAPLDKALFTIEVPDAYRLQSSTYALSEAHRRGEISLYRFERRQFLPSHDLTIRWTRVKL
jgi:hypothetical protein